MPLLGKGAMVPWHDADALADFSERHSEEHLAERVGVPGFLRDYLFVAEDCGPKYCILYEVEELATSTSKPDLDRLDHPTPWRPALDLGLDRDVQRGGPVRRRGPCSATTIGCSGACSRASARADQAAGRARPHLLEGDQAASGIVTEEKRLRGIPDRTTDWRCCSRAYDADSIRRRLPVRSRAALAGHDAAPAGTDAPYRLLDRVTDADLST